MTVSSRLSTPFLSEDRIYVKIISQVSLQVLGFNIFRELQERVLKWAFDPKRNLNNIPDGAWSGESFEIDSDNSERAAAIKLDTPKYWAFRLSERLKDTSRIWTTEIGIAETSASSALIGCRLICSQRGISQPIPASIPSFIRGIAFATDAYLDSRQTSADPWIIDSDAAVEELVAFLSEEKRNHPLVMFSLPEGSSSEHETAIPVVPYIRRTAGYVHAAIITSDASFALTNRIGKELSVYRQAVRTYNPGFDYQRDLSIDHPVASIARINALDEASPGSFFEFLVQQTLRLTRPRDVLEQEQPSFQQIKRISAEIARHHARDAKKSDAELLELADVELRSAQQQVQESLELAISAETERDTAVQSLQQLKISYATLQDRLASLQKEASLSNGFNRETPKNFDEIDVWATDNLSGLVELHEKAIKAAKASDFKNIKLAYDALLMMRDFYVPMRKVGGIEKNDAFKQRMAELGLENSKCFTQENKARGFGGDYFLSYHGSRRELDWHLKGSNSRDGRTAFRMYYFWDDDTSRVIVGYFPGHLQTDIS